MLRSSCRLEGAFLLRRAGGFALVITLFCFITFASTRARAQAGEQFDPGRNRVDPSPGFQTYATVPLQEASSDSPTTAFELIRDAERGDALAQNNLAYLYTYGKGLPRDYSEAAKWYAAAARRSVGAQYNLGVLYEHGMGVPRDYSRAASYYLGAAEHGHVPAQVRPDSYTNADWVFPRTRGRPSNGIGRPPSGEIPPLNAE